MASSFPAALPESKTDFSSETLVASTYQNEQGEDINAIATKVGVDGSTVPTSLDYLIKSLHDGALWNGKIVPSVANNDLTLALKGWDGNDPSASNVVYLRIGGVVRSITSALSVTLADGTNWFNAGSAELATREIDYFAYLGYNSTDGVVIGFSRIPYANEYNNFSTTSTNEKYCAISTITNAASGDDYVVIGRFAATLSAGAGYTWTVPTFTNKNLRQRPTYETRVLYWLPTYTCSASMTYASVNSYIGTRTGYKISGNTMFVYHFADGTTGGTASNTIYFTCPMSFGLTYGTFSGWYYDGAAPYAPATVINDGANKVGFRKADASNFGLGTTRQVCSSGSISLEV